MPVLCRVLLVSLLAALTSCVENHNGATTNPSEKQFLSGGSSDPSIINDEWMKSALSFDFSESPKRLVDLFRASHARYFDEFFRFDSTTPYYLNSSSVDIDEDPETEHFLMVGEDVGSYLFLVVDRRPNGWRIVFHERIDEKYGRPVFDILNIESQQKTVRIQTALASGSGAYGRQDSFYKLIDGEFREVLSIPARIEFWNAVGINQSVSIDVHPVEFQGDILYVKFNYGFYPNEYDAERLYAQCRALDSSYNEALVSDTGVVQYGFNKRTKRYECIQADACVSAEKVEAMRMMGEDAWFAAAFREELRELLRSEDPCKRKAAAYFLGFAK